LCHVCETAFLPHADTCLQCGQSKCAETIRIPYVFVLHYGDYFADVHLLIDPRR
jgi:hypothetical protein